MGLDQYLYAEKYLSNYTEPDLATKIRSMFPELPSIDNLNSVEVKFEVGYWRKANAIHNWFVENIQNGNDDCGNYYISKNSLKSLKEECLKVINASELVEGEIINGYSIKDGKKIPIKEKGKIVVNSKVAEEVLPTTSGFFFGRTDYDQWYIEDLKSTVEIIDNCLKLDDSWEFKYSSSW